jgi:hypothetical protein
LPQITVKWPRVERENAMLNRRLTLILMGTCALVPPALAATGEDAKFADIAKRWL